jgi:hypothetical protein
MWSMVPYSPIEFDAPYPYCNRDDLRILEDNQDLLDNDERAVQALLDLDHFFPKYKYPFLTVSVFNLVPSCHNVISVKKG